MSIPADTHSAHHDDHGHDQGGHQGSLKDYLIGFALSVVLTAVPFWIVMDDVFRKPQVAAFVILAFAVVQIVVHMVYFLHMNTKSEGGWTFLALLFTLTLVVITLVGSIWVMYHMDKNMMPMTPHEALQKP